MVSIERISSQLVLGVPQRKMRYVLVLCTAGVIDMVVDEQHFRLAAGDVITITSGQVHYYSAIENAQGFILEFTLDFFCKDDNDVELIFHNGLFCHFAMNEVIPVDQSLVETQLALIETELNEKPYQYLISLHSRIALILVAINRAKVSRGDEIWKPEALFLKYLEAVRGNFEHNYSVADFAQMLGTTEVKLNELSKLHSGKTAQAVIFGLVTAEAKRLLVYGDLTIKEVAYKLGFNDPFYFSNFFKKQTDLSPKVYKEKFVG